MDENNFWLKMNGMLAICLTIIFVSLIVFYHYRILSMAEKGYCEVQGYGTSALLWQKCK